nr:type II toxin-antitoxin system RelE/ParE family toxin [Allomuricauda sp.]
MDYNVQIAKEAQIQLAVAECFYRTKGLEREFLADFSEQIGFLKKTPDSFQAKYREIRAILFKTFNYSIHYIIRDHQVLILRILNQRQHF